MKRKIMRVLVLIFVAVAWVGCAPRSVIGPEAEAEQVKEDCAPVFEWLEMCEPEAK